MASLADLLKELQDAYVSSTGYVVSARLGTKPTPTPAGSALQGAPLAAAPAAAKPSKVITGSGSPLNGTSKADYIVGATTAQQINGLAGNDTINGGGGNDSMDGGLGVDLVSFAPYGGSNRYAAGVIADLGAGTYGVNGGGGGTIINFENIEGSTGADWLQGNAVDNLLLGGLGNDSILGLAGKDKLYGGDGNDALDGGDGDDYLDGGVGNDALYGGIGRNQLFGGGGDDYLEGGINDDVLNGGDGNDGLFGGAGSNVLIGGTGEDVAIIDTPGFYNTGSNKIDTGDDGDLIGVSSGRNEIKAGAGEDWIFAWGGSGNDSIDGAAAAAMTNKIDGGSGEDFISVAAGNAKINGGAGEDVIYAGWYGGPIPYSGYWGTYLNIPYYPGENFANSFEVDGGDDNDWILTGIGNDKVNGGAGEDIIGGLDGLNTLIGGSGNDYIAGGDDADFIKGGTGNDGLEGYWGADTFVGGSGDDWIYAGYDSAFDSISGGDGQQDVIVFGGDLDYKGLVVNTDNGVDNIYDLDRCTDDVNPNGDILDVSIAFTGNTDVTAATLGSYVWVKAIDAENSELFVDPSGSGPDGGAGILWARLNGIAPGDEVTIKANDLTTDCVKSFEELHYTVGYSSGGTGGSAGSAGIWLDGSGGTSGVYDSAFDTLLAPGSGLTADYVNGTNAFSIDAADFANNHVTVEWQIIAFPALDVSGFNEDDKVVINLAANDTNWGGAATLLGYSASNYPPTAVGSFAGFSSTAETQNFRRLSRSLAYTYPTGSGWSVGVNVHLQGQVDVTSNRTKLFATGIASGTSKFYTTSGHTDDSNRIFAKLSTPLAVGFNPATLTASQFSFIVPNYSQAVTV